MHLFLSLYDSMRLKIQSKKTSWSAVDAKIKGALKRQMESK
jgi:hypothetical protein